MGGVLLSFVPVPISNTCKPREFSYAMIIVSAPYWMIFSLTMSKPAFGGSALEKLVYDLSYVIAKVSDLSFYTV